MTRETTGARAGLVRAAGRAGGVVLAGLALMAVQGEQARAACDPGERVVKFAHVVAEKGHPKGEAASAFAARANRELDGRLCVEVYPNSTLYNDDKVLEAMLLGDVQLAAPSLSKMEAYTLKFRIFDLPFLFNSDQAVYRFQDSDDGLALSRSVEDKGLLVLGYWPNGMKQLSASRPLVVPGDARGLKFRIQASDVIEAQFRALGANPQKMAFSEVYGALQAGVVDGQENTWSNIYTQKFFEVQDGITETDHGILTYGVVTSAAFWNSLAADERQALVRIMEEVTGDARDAASRSAAASKAAIIRTGGVVRVPTPQQRDLWIRAMKPVWDEFSEQIGPDLIGRAQEYND